MRSRAFALLVSTLLVLFAPRADAEFPSIDARRFQPPTDPAGSLYLEPTPTPGPWAWNAAAWVGYGYRPAVLRDPDGAIVGDVVKHQVFGDVLANVGIGERLALGFDLPVVLFQEGDATGFARLVGAPAPTKPALGDLALVAKGNLVGYGSLGGFGLSSLFRFTAPTGREGGYAGEGTPTAELRVLAEYKLLALSLQGTAGFRLRFEETDVLRRTYGHEIPWGVAVSLRPQILGLDDKGRFTWVAEVHGAGLLPPGQAARDRGQSAPVSPVFAGLSARYAIGEVSLLLGAETALTQAFGGTPIRAVGSVQWAPRTHDADRDGVPDEIDQCPELAEDRDGFQDADGCPDFDNDDDGVPDGQDRCPREKEDEDGYQDADGCPEPDNDLDGVLDTDDACPNEPGVIQPNPKVNGCLDRDRDGVPDASDKCPDQAEDTDGFEDADGCPDPDNDKDGVLDADDVCPTIPRGASADRKRPGCPATDQDGDTVEDSADRCPAEPETFNGVDDEDGCPDTGGKPLVVVQEKGSDVTVTFAAPVQFKGSAEAPEIDPASAPVLRALAAELNRHKTWVAAVGVRPQKDDPFGQQAALARAFVVVDTLRRYATRDGVAETVGFRAVEKLPGAAKSGFGVLVLVPPSAPAK